MEALDLMTENVEQREAWVAITKSLRHVLPWTNTSTIDTLPDRETMFFIQGAGGTGKTFLYNAYALASTAELLTPMHCQEANSACKFAKKREITMSHKHQTL